MVENFSQSVPPVENEELSDFLLACQRYLMKHPQVSRELIASLVEEGRRYAQTDEGSAWMVALADTELVKRTLFIWEAYGLDLLLEARPVVTPSTWLNMILAAVSNPDLENILSLLIVEEMRGGNVGPA